MPLIPSQAPSEVRRRFRTDRRGPGQGGRRLALPLASVLTAIFLGAAAAPTADTPAVPTGAWGGRGISLEVEDSGAKVELDCAHGRISNRLVLDADGRFELPGTLTRERPGPVHMGPGGEAEEEKAEPAHYSGQLDHDKLRLSIRLERGERAIGPLELQAGRSATLHKCL